VRDNLNTHKPASLCEASPRGSSRSSSGTTPPNTVVGWTWLNPNWLAMLFADGAWPRAHARFAQQVTERGGDQQEGPPSDEGTTCHRSNGAAMSSPPTVNTATPIFPDLVKDVVLERLKQLWVADLTYVPLMRRISVLATYFH
jgi:hypothetical protein